MFDFITNFIFREDLDKITALYPYSSIRKHFNKIIVDIDSDTDNIYKIEFVKHWDNSITCSMINDWCDFAVDFKEYGDKIHDIVKEFNDKVKEHKKCWDKLSSRGSKVQNIRFQEMIYEVYVKEKLYMKSREQLK